MGIIKKALKKMGLRIPKNNTCQVCGERCRFSPCKRCIKKALVNITKKDK